MLDLKPIDWHQAWFASVLPAYQSLNQSLVITENWREAFNAQAHIEGVRNHQDLPIHFIPQADLPENAAYEQHIGQTGGVPTRDNWHDFFNALVWLSFPKIKRELNAIQAKHIASYGITAQRGRIRDAATLFDENALLMLVEQGSKGDEWIAKLRDHQWEYCLCEQRDFFQKHISVWVFGHALMEKAVHIYKAVTAHTYIVRTHADFFSWKDSAQQCYVDECVSQSLRLTSLVAQCFTPLPIMGIPDWCEGQTPAFYQDQHVFRPRRK